MARGVIFDVDGTLVDSVDLHAQAWQDSFRIAPDGIFFAAQRRPRQRSVEDKSRALDTGCCPWCLSYC
jgi:beta-phosphoglucomutase-like phosphatase (HAD superfamily)